MMKNSEDFSMQEAMRLAASPAGQQLFALLQQSRGAELQEAMDQASKGDYSAMKKTMSALLADPKAQELLRQMGR